MSQRARQGKQPGRGGVWFASALGSFLLSLVVFLLVIGAKCGDSAGGATPVPSLPPLNTPTPPAQATPTPTLPPPPSPTATATPTVAGPPASDGDTSPLVTCGDILAPLDKQHRLARDCAPPDLVTLPGAISSGGTQLMRAQPATALEAMLADAAKAGLQIFAASSYRSYDQQVVTFQQNVASGGLEYAERTSAHAGHSEHQLGTTTDLTSASNGFGLEGFENTPEGQWIGANSWKYGFIISYPDGKESITGYAYEPWHVRWLGVDVAAKVHASGLTLHEYLLKP